MDINLPDNYCPYEVMTDSLKDTGSWNIFGLKYLNLPLSLQNILMDSPTMEFVAEISDTYHLLESQARELSRIMGNVIIGDLFIGNMTSEIGERLNLPPETAQQIRNQIVSELFAPAIEDIKKVQREKFANKIGNQPQTPAPKPPTDINPGNVVNLRNK